tara:strand:- start:402 stop:704 length:303 start_codon:yes stop_codon:yes gene_type:complete
MDDNSYHFGGLDDWIADAIQSGVNAETIYKEVIGSVRRQVKHHKTCYKTSRELHELFSNRQYFDVVGDEKDILLQDKPKINSKITKINIAVPNHPDYTEL